MNSKPQVTTQSIYRNYVLALGDTTLNLLTVGGQPMLCPLLFERDDR